MTIALAITFLPAPAARAFVARQTAARNRMRAVVQASQPGLSEAAMMMR
jgi:hypothetical protein